MRTDITIPPGFMRPVDVQRHNSHHSWVPQKSCKACRYHGTAWLTVGYPKP